MNILLFLNTNYHVETVLSIYKSLLLLGNKPTILLDYDPDFTDPTRLDFEFENFIKNYNINYITKNEYFKHQNSFDRCVIISGDIFLKKINDLPDYYNKIKYIINDFSNSTVFISHVANYSKLYDQADTYYKNYKIVSVTQFSQKFNLQYFNQVENIFLDKISVKKYLNTSPKFLILGRFCWQNRNLKYVDEILKLDKILPKPIEISIIGEKPFSNNKISFLENRNLTNINLNIKFNISEINFYNEINNTDYLMNLIDFHHGPYFINKFSSNITHTIAFAKPNLCFMPLNLVYNLPCIEYTATDFKDKFLECVNMNEENYLIISNSFEKIKNNMRNHNNLVLNNLLN
jgi:hypothetical protein